MLTSTNTKNDTVKIDSSVPLNKNIVKLFLMGTVVCYTTYAKLPLTHTRTHKEACFVVHQNTDVN